MAELVPKKGMATPDLSSVIGIASPLAESSGFDLPPPTPQSAVAPATAQPATAPQPQSQQIPLQQQLFPADTEVDSDNSGSGSDEDVQPLHEDDVMQVLHDSLSSLRVDSGVDSDQSDSADEASLMEPVSGSLAPAASTQSLLQRTNVPLQSGSTMKFSSVHFDAHEAAMLPPSQSADRFHGQVIEQRTTLPAQLNLSPVEMNELHRRLEQQKEQLNEFFELREELHQRAVDELESQRHALASQDEQQMYIEQQLEAREQQLLLNEQALEDRRAKLESAVRAQVADLELECTNLRRQMSDALQRRGDAETQVSALQAQLNALQAQNLALKTQLSDVETAASEKVQTLSRRLSTAEEKSEKLQKSLESTAAQEQRLQSDLRRKSEAETQVSALQAQLEDLTALNAALKTQLADAAASSAEQIQLLVKQVAVAEEKNALLQSQHLQLAQADAQQRGDSESQVSALQAQLDALQIQNNALKTQLSDAENTASEQLQAHTLELNTAKDAAARQLFQAEETRIALQHALDSSVAQLEQLQQEHLQSDLQRKGESESQLTALQAQLHDQKTQNLALKTQLADVEAANSENQHKVLEMTKRFSSAEEKCGLLQKSLDSTTAQYEQLLTTSSAASTEQARQKQLNHEQRDQLRVLQTYLQQLETTSNDLVSQLDSQTRQCLLQANSLQTLQKSHAELKSRLEEVSAKNEKLEHERITSQNEHMSSLAQMQRQFDQLTQQSAGFIEDQVSLLRTQNAELVSSLSQADTRIHSLLQQSSVQQDAHQVEMDGLRHQLETVRNLAVSFDVKSKQLTEQREVMQTQLDELTAQVADRDAQLVHQESQYSTTLSSLKLRVADLEKQLSEATRRSESLSQHLESTQKQHDAELRTLQHRMESLMEAHRAEVSAQEQSTIQHVGLIKQQYEAELHSLQQQLSDTARTLSSATVQVQSLTEQLQLVHQQRELDLNELHTQLDVSMESSTAEQAELLAQLDTVARELDTSRKAYIALQQQLSSVQQQNLTAMQALQQDAEQAQQAHLTRSLELQAQLDALEQRRMTELETQRQKHESAAQELADKIAALQLANSRVTSDLEQAKREHDEAQSAERSQHESAVYELNESIANLQLAKDALSEQLAQLKQQHDQVSTKLQSELQQATEALSLLRQQHESISQQLAKRTDALQQVTEQASHSKLQHDQIEKSLQSQLHQSTEAMSAFQQHHETLSLELAKRTESLQRLTEESREAKQTYDAQTALTLQQNDAAVKAAQGRLDDVTQTLQTLQNDWQQQRTELVAVTQDLDMSRRREQDVNQQAAEMYRQLHEAQTFCQQATDQISFLTQKLTNVQQQYDADVHEQQLQLEQSATALTDAGTRLDALTEQLVLQQKHHSAEKETLQMQLAAASERQQKAEAHIVTLQSQYDSDLVRLQQQVEVMLANALQTQQQHDSTVADLQKRLDAASTSADQVAARLADTVEQLDQLRAQHTLELESLQQRHASDLQAQQQTFTVQSDATVKGLQEEFGQSLALRKSALEEAQARAERLEQELQTAIKQRDAEHAALRELQAEFGDQLNASLQQQESIEAHIAMHAELGSELTPLKVKSEEQTGEIVQLRTRVVLLEQERDAARQSETQLQSQLTKLVAEHSVAADQVSTLTQHKLVSTQDVESLTRDLAGTREQLAAVRQQADEQVAALKQQLEDLLHSSRLTQQTQLDQQTAVQQQLCEQLLVEESRQAELNERLEEQDSQLNQCRAQIQQLIAENTALKSATKDDSAKAAELAALRDKFDEQDSQMKRCRSEIRQLTEVKDTLTDAVKHSSANSLELTELRVKFTDLMKSHDALQAKLTSSEQARALLLTAYDKSTDQRFALEQHRDSALQHNLELTQQLDQTRERLKSLPSELQHDFEIELTRRSSTADALQTEVAKLQQERESTQQLIQSVVSETDALKQSLSETQREASKVRDELVAVQRQYHICEEKLRFTEQAKQTAADAHLRLVTELQESVELLHVQLKDAMQQASAVAVLKTELELVQRDLQSARTANNTLRTEFNETIARLNTVTEDLWTEQKAHLEVQNQLKTAIQDAAEQQQQHSQLLNDREAHFAQIQRQLSEECAAVVAEKLELQLAVERYHLEDRQAKLQQKRLQQQIDLLEAQHQRTDEHYRTLLSQRQEELERSFSAQRSADGQVQAQSSEVTQLQRELTRLQQIQLHLQQQNLELQQSDHARDAQLRQLQQQCRSQQEQLRRSQGQSTELDELHRSLHDHSVAQQRMQSELEQLQKSNTELQESSQRHQRNAARMKHYMDKANQQASALDAMNKQLRAQLERALERSDSQTADFQHQQSVASRSLHHELAESKVMNAELMQRVASLEDELALTSDLSHSRFGSSAGSLEASGRRSVNQLSVTPNRHSPSKLSQSSSQFALDAPVDLAECLQRLEESLTSRVVGRAVSDLMTRALTFSVEIGSIRVSETLVRLLAQRLQTVEPPLVSVVLDVLSLLFLQDANAMCTPAREAILPIVALLHDASSNQTVRASAGVLARLCKDPENQSAAVMAGCIGAVVGALSLYVDDTKCCIHLCTILSQLTFHDEYREDVAQRNGIQELVAAMQAHWDELAVLQHASGALWHLSHGVVSLKAAVLEAGGTEALLTALRQHSTDDEFVAHVCATLWNLASEDSNRALLSTDGLGTIITVFDHHENALVLENCCGLLCTLAQDEECAAEVGTHQNLLEKLVNILQLYHTNTQLLKTCLNVVAVLALNVNNRQAFVDLNAVAAIEQLHDDSLRDIAAAAQRQLTA
eukprot:TRINITY_DN11929_c0_g3_i2.p1 TRINITY_DN11929_c0_g3~~TRINITY_DN11929_c0_g3_i2.p1  ORF type:complete len:3000 (+),score=928.45 TRINITY_DN11929_c0_g3_i2:657-9002(+)